MHRLRLRRRSSVDSNMDHLHALVDMGSNGIRFSITDMSGSTPRILPTLFQDRAPISLYDAQYNASSEERQPIPESVMEQVVNVLKRWHSVCTQFQIPNEDLTVLATEATRTSINREDFRVAIEGNTQWALRTIPKLDESNYGVWGVASSFNVAEGLVMDLGGGSTQLNWIQSNGETVNMSSTPSSLPYGAAKLSRQLAIYHDKPNGLNELKNIMRAEFQQAYQDMKVSPGLELRALRSGGFTLYLSGGGFRGWGNILMHEHHIKPYPIPIINGFEVSGEDFKDIDQLISTPREEVYRISKRRANQVPAIAFLVEVLVESLPQVKAVRFCQGGIREGYLFSTLPPKVRGRAPLLIAALPYGEHRNQSADALLHILRRATDLPWWPSHTITRTHVAALVCLMYHHHAVSKDARAAAALHTTTSGVLAAVHGLTHTDRALLALMLCERWGGQIPPADTIQFLNLQALVGRECAWWCRYVGRVAQLLGSIYPLGLLPSKEDYVGLQVETGMLPIPDLATGQLDKTEKQSEGIVLFVNVKDSDPIYDGASVETLSQEIRKVGKKKKGWIAGFGFKVEVVVERGLVQVQQELQRQQRENSGSWMLRRGREQRDPLERGVAIVESEGGLLPVLDGPLWAGAGGPELASEGETSPLANPIREGGLGREAGVLEEVGHFGFSSL